MLVAFHKFSDVASRIPLSLSISLGFHVSWRLYSSSARAAPCPRGTQILSSNIKWSRLVVFRYTTSNTCRCIDYFLPLLYHISSTGHFLIHFALFFSLAQRTHIRVDSTHTPSLHTSHHASSPSLASYCSSSHSWCSSTEFQTARTSFSSGAGIPSEYANVRAYLHGPRACPPTSFQA